MDLKSIYHDKPHFFKYYNFDVVKLVLKNKTVKWSSPVIFNDPFDLQVDIDYDFQMEDMKETLLEEITRIVYSEKEPAGNSKNNSFAMLLELRNYRKKVSVEKFKDLFGPAINKGAENAQIALEEGRSMWKKFRNRLRVFCVSEINDDLLMWAHYSDCHTGAVLKLKCLKGKNRALSAAVPVQYQEDLPKLATKKEFIKDLTGQIELNADNSFKVFATTKSVHWDHEKEWRCIVLDSSSNGQLYEYGRILPQEIESIYLGCKMKIEKQEEILSMLIGDLNHVQVYKAYKNLKYFKLIFKQIR